MHNLSVRSSAAEAQKEPAGHNQNAPRGWLNPASLASREPTSFKSKNSDFIVRTFKLDREP